MPRKKSDIKKHEKMVKKAIKKHHIAGEKKERAEEKIEERLHPGIHKIVRKIQKRKKTKHNPY